jgi:hypothetical protein
MKAEPGMAGANLDVLPIRSLLLPAGPPGDDTVRT